MVKAFRFPRKIYGSKNWSKIRGMERKIFFTESARNKRRKFDPEDFHFSRNRNSQKHDNWIISESSLGRNFCESSEVKFPSAL